MKILLPFPTTYLCEAEFFSSSVTKTFGSICNMETGRRVHLFFIKPDLFQKRFEKYKIVPLLSPISVLEKVIFHETMVFIIAILMEQYVFSGFSVFIPKL